MNCTRRVFIKSGLLATAGLPLLQGCGLEAKRADTDALFKAFRNSPVTSKPFVRWWWNGDKLSAAEIARELDVMHAAGIGGVEINPIAFPGGDDLGIKSLTWLSPEWIEMLKVALVEIAKRNMVADIIVSSGWPFGGEFLSPEDQTQLMTRASSYINGPGRQLIKVHELLREAAPKVYSGYKGATSELHALYLAPTEMDTFTPAVPIPFTPGSEAVSIDVPAGKHVLYALVKVTGFQSVILGAPGAAGPVLNHYSPQAVEKFLNNMSSKLFPAIQGLKGFRSLFCDSMELEGANWYADFPSEFLRRKGYDVTPYLPFILYKVGHMGHAQKGTVDTVLTGSAREEIDRVRYDFFTACIEIVRDHFLKPYTQWCNRHGYLSRVQAYGREFHPLEASFEVDIPECETWLRIGKAYATSVNKFVASAVHMAGKKVVSCEEITNTSHVFNATLDVIKRVGDHSNLSGVTHSVLCGFNYSPPDTPFPGWVRFGVFFNERNPWWPWFNLWATYKARLSTVFQETEAYADIAVLHPLADMWTIHGPQRDPFPSLRYPPYQYQVWEAIHRNGHACDYISEGVIGKSTVADGCISYGNCRYSTLLCIETETIEPTTAKAMAEFAGVGGRLIFIAKEPHKSPGWKDHTVRDEEVKKHIAHLKSKFPSQVFTVDAPTGNDLTLWFRDVQKQCGLTPYLEIAAPNPHLSQIRHCADGRDFFFFVNSSPTKHVATEIRFTQLNGRTPVLWDPETGKRFACPGVEGDRLKLELYPSTSQLIVLEKAADLPPFPGVLPPVTGEAIDDWSIRLKHLFGESESQGERKLYNLGSDPATQSFAGTITYTKEVDDVQQRSVLDLGIVHGVSEVTVNGVSLGCRWYGRHAYALPPNVAKAARKRIEVKVTTVTGNYIKSQPENHAHGWVRHQSWQPMGMLGPVRLG